MFFWPPQTNRHTHTHTNFFFARPSLQSREQYRVISFEIKIAVFTLLYCLYLFFQSRNKVSNTFSDNIHITMKIEFNIDYFLDQKSISSFIVMIATVSFNDSRLHNWQENKTVTSLLVSGIRTTVEGQANRFDERYLSLNLIFSHQDQKTSLMMSMTSTWRFVIFNRWTKNYENKQKFGWLIYEKKIHVGQIKALFFLIFFDSSNRRKVIFQNSSVRMGFNNPGETIDCLISVGIVFLFLEKQNAKIERTQLLFLLLSFEYVWKNEMGTNLKTEFNFNSKTCSLFKINWFFISF